MASRIETFFQDAQLSMAAYANLTVGMSRDQYEAALRVQGFSTPLAANFADRYAILSPSIEGFGFSATLFLDKTTNQKVLAVRGTNDFLDLIIADGLILAGAATLIEPQYTALKDYYLQLKDELKILPGEQIAVAGHSFGGFLAQLFSVDQAANVSQTFTYNAPGIGGAVAQLLESLGITSANIPLAQITNIISKNGFSATAGLGTQLGAVANIFIEASLNPFHNHSIAAATDALALYDLFAVVDVSLDIATMNRILEMSSDSAPKSLEAGLDALRKLFRVPADQNSFVPTPSSGSAEDRNVYYLNLQAAKAAIPPGTYGIVNLAGAQAADLENLARTNIAYRYAVRELNPFVVAGVDYHGLHNAEGQLELVSTDGTGALSDQYLQDRTAFLVEKLNFNNLDAIVNALSTTRFEDRASGYTIPPLLTLKRYIFGQDVPEAPLVGGLGEDHLYGAGGDDQILGLGGADYLEGNRGKDILDGGSGADRMFGGAGDDTYYVDVAGDQVTETTGGGIDTVISSAPLYVLADHVENMTVAGGVLGQGNDLENELQATTKGAKLFGGQGNDHYVVTVEKTELLEVAGGGVDTVESSVSATLGANLEDLTLTGQSGIDGTGNDQNNTLIGNSASNVLSGLGGQDHLLGGAGVDILIGGKGNDLLEGGADADVYVYNTGDGVDRIEDTEGQNLIVYDGQLLLGGVRGTEDAPNTYKSLDGRITFLRSGGDLIVNSNLILNENFQDGQFGIRLVDEVGYANGLPIRTNADYVGPLPDRTPIFNDGPQALVLATDPVSSGGSSGGFNVSIHALGGDDVVSAFGDGNDQLFGDDGDDWLIGAGGDDRLYGGDGNDVLDGDSGELSNSTPGRDRLEGGAGNDRLIGKEHADILLGGPGNDELYGDGGNESTWDASQDANDVLDGGEGNDFLYGGGGDDILAGGDDDDSLWGDYGNTAFDAIGGADTLDGGSGHDALVGGGGADILFGGDGNDLLIGDSPLVGNRVVGGNDVLYGGDGNDDLIGQGGNDTLFGGGGDDSLWGDNQGNSFLGSSDDFLDGGSGNDHLYGEEGRDVLEGGADNDDLQGGDDDDQLTGGAGSDVLIGDDSVNGRAYTLSVAPGTDVLDGGDGNDTLSGSGGDDQVIGGSGNDVLFGDDWTFDPIALGPIGNPFDGGPLELVFGSAPGNDMLDGGEGDDVLFGGGGNDTLIGGVGSDYLFGDLGSFSDIGGADRLDGGEGDDHLDGGAGDDVLTGGAGGDYLVAGSGDDLLDGGDGDDTLVGVDGTNTLVGGAGNDQLFDGAGDDLFDAGVGNDFMRGGAGSDTYLFGRGSGRDWVVNQSFDGADTIRLAADITPGDVAVARDGENLVLRLQGSSDQLTIENYFRDVFDQVAFVQFTDGTSWDAERIKDLILTGSGQGGKLQGFTDRNDVMTGAEGSQLLVGLGGDDTLDGGPGSDRLKGGGGSDTYRFGLGSGADTLFDRAGDADMVQMGTGILPGNVAVLTNGTDLALKLRDTTDSLVISNFYVDSSFQVEQVSFEDGTAWDRTTLQSLAQPALGGFDFAPPFTSAAASISGDSQNAPVTGGGVAAADFPSLPEDLPMVLTGTDGTDVLVGGAGGDLLDGAAGNDYLFGFEGNDTYHFGIGSGQDVVLDYDRRLGNVDTIQLGFGVTPEQITVVREGDDLVVGIDGTDDRLTLQSFLLGPTYRVERMVFSDGAMWDAETIRDKARAVTQGTGGNDFLIGQGNGQGVYDNLIVGEGGNDTLIGDAGTSTQLAIEGQDKLLGGDGNDRLFGGGDDDVLDGGAGDDRLYGDAVFSNIHFDNAGPSLNPGNDTLFGGDGSDILHGQRGDDVLDGGADADELFGDEGNDTLLGGAGDDTLYGDILFNTVWGNDTLDGGEGNDTLIGGAGADTYVFGRGSGQDVVMDNDFSALPQVNTIRLASDLTPADVNLQRVVDPSRQELGPGDLLLTLNGSPDRLALQGFFSGFNANFFRVQFDDGTVWDAEQMKVNAGFTIAGTPDADQLIAYDQRDVLQGQEGDDWLADNGLAATLAGGMGDDRYRVTIETASIEEAADEGMDYVESFVDYTLPANVENLTLLDTDMWRFLPDGSFGPDPELNATLGTGNELDNVLIGNSADNILSGGDGNDTLRGGSVGSGGEGGGFLPSGNDFLIGGSGDDTYLYGWGDGRDTIVDRSVSGEGNRILFGEGITQDDLTFFRDRGTFTIALNLGGGGGGGGGGGEGGLFAEGDGEGDGGSEESVQDEIVLQNFDPNGVNGSLVVERLEFADGSFISLADLFPSSGPVPTEGDDELSYGADDDTVDALGGDDIVDADGGNDTVFGGAGNDTIFGGEGNDTLAGGGGTDHLFGGPGHDTYLFNLGDGVDTITDQALHGEGNDLVFGPGITPDDLRLGIGSLLIRVGTNGDAIHLDPFDPADAYGPHAIDTFRFDDGTTLTYSQLIDRGFDLTGTEGDDTITGTNAVDRISGFDGNDVLSSGDGNDVLDGGTGADILTGGSGDDTYLVDDGGDTVTELPGEGVDTVQSTVSYSLAANVENLTLVGIAAVNGTGNELANVLIGNDAANVLDGRAGADVLIGGVGNDTLIGGAGDDVYSYNLGDGLDQVSDSAGTDTIRFGDGISFDNTVIRLMEAAGITTAQLRLLDEFGNETIDQGLDITLGAGGTSPIETLTFSDGTSYALADLEIQTVVTSGTKHGDVIRTGRHDDIIYGEKGGDTIYAGSGNDTVFAGKGGDVVFGEAGDDALYGDKGDDVLDGGYGNDVVNGDKGDDILRGGGGDDTLYGDKGDDVLEGGAGHDLLDGGKGKDRLMGGLGDDVLDSGEGNDTILFGRGDGQDTLAGGEHNKHDVVRFGEDIDPLDLMLSRQVDNLRVAIYGSTDQFTVQDWYADKDNRVDEFVAGNGRSLEDAKVDQLIQAMASFTSQTGLSWEEAIAQRPEDVEAILAANWQ